MDKKYVYTVMETREPAVRSHTEASERLEKLMKV